MSRSYLSTPCDTSPAPGTRQDGNTKASGSLMGTAWLFPTLLGLVGRCGQLPFPGVGLGHALGRAQLQKEKPTLSKPTTRSPQVMFSAIPHLFTSSLFKSLQAWCSSAGAEFLPGHCPKVWEGRCRCWVSAYQAHTSHHKDYFIRETHAVTQGTDQECINSLKGQAKQGAGHQNAWQAIYLPAPWLLEIPRGESFGPGMKEKRSFLCWMGQKA